MIIGAVAVEIAVKETESSIFPFEREEIKLEIGSVYPEDRNEKMDVKGRDFLIFAGQWCVDWALSHNKGLELDDFEDLEVLE